MKTNTQPIGALKVVDGAYIKTLLDLQNGISVPEIKRILNKSRELHGLSPQEVASLLMVENPELVKEMFEAAHFIKEKIYGKRLVIFAPLYYSNHCCNNCLYCGFRKDNIQARRQLSLDEVVTETKLLIEQGHKRLLVIAGEDNSPDGFNYLLQVIKTIYKTRSGRGEIRRVNVEMAPMTIEQFRELKAAGIGTYVVFQETYHTETYKAVHPSGPKADFDWRVTVMDRAMTAGVDDVGIGVLFGLYDYRFDVLGLILHAKHLEETFGTGPHTLSVPRIEYAAGAPLTSAPPHPVNDFDFKKIVAILRMAVPYTGIILSTREPPNLRRELVELGVSQISAGSKTDPGGYSSEANSVAQFAVSDERPLDEVICDMAGLGYLPSFCTGCYRLRRTGKDFMELAKPGDIKHHCDPNAISTFEEYLIDYGSEKTREVGKVCIEHALEQMEEKPRQIAMKMLEQIRVGKRDVFC
ncbi:MAG: [FeFe] hydrogenase H-cluster radical SAM maturase HydG [Candidatus Riflebacteria bacterium]|nr:[FeFe] hydrogenase H-cluster radical SAM maturase HydG [Candidatus Riflebacteria bacterium]